MIFEFELHVNGLHFIHLFVDSNRTRRLLTRSKPEVQGTAKVLSMLQSVAPAVKVEPDAELEAGTGDGAEGAIVLDTIAEFCRQVGEKEEGESWLGCVLRS